VNGMFQEINSIRTKGEQWVNIIKYIWY
jgi:hypothetical protein